MNNFVSNSSASFIHKVLLTLQRLQGIPEFHDGVKLNDIVAYMKTKSDGDVLNQVKTALLHSECKGYVQKHNENYQLVAGAAKIHQMPCCSSKRLTEINRVKNIFSTKWVSGKSYQDFLALQETSGQTAVVATCCCGTAVDGDIQVLDEKSERDDNKQHDNLNKPHHSKPECVEKFSRATFSINECKDQKQKFENEIIDVNLDVPICKTPLIIDPNKNPGLSLNTTSDPRPLQIKDFEPGCSTGCKRQLLDKHKTSGKQRKFDNHHRELRSRSRSVQIIRKSRSRSPSLVRINRNKLRSDPNKNPVRSLNTTSDSKPLKIKDYEPGCSTDCKRQLLDEHKKSGIHHRELRSPSLVRISRKKLGSGIHQKRKKNRRKK